MSDTVTNALVWCEIPVTDLNTGVKFYSAVFNTKLEPTEFDGGEIAFFPHEGDTDSSGHIYVGKPAEKGTGGTIHLNAPDNLEATVARAFDAGGEIVGEPVTIPSGRFQYMLDPDGNSIGIFELAA
ncbi:VOC family protein [Halocynthiibacter sp. C4]|uniref:VOC family protein n=1 Tax=Halocynthiibacter sp. C4 TaxID=2992758 RepID=UPI00237B0E0A|nr:VOC family protein [Halocynthiibacter sp. C4]MDE0590642.1 VOC family protein [Halocynthiibacter sp. C4]